MALCQHPNAFTHFFTDLFLQSDQKLSPAKANVTAVRFHIDYRIERNTTAINPKAHMIEFSWS